MAHKNLMVTSKGGKCTAYEYARNTTGDSMEMESMKRWWERVMVSLKEVEMAQSKLMEQNASDVEDPYINLKLIQIIRSLNQTQTSPGFFSCPLRGT